MKVASPKGHKGVNANIPPKLNKPSVKLAPPASKKGGIRLSKSLNIKQPNHRISEME